MPHTTYSWCPVCDGDLVVIWCVDLAEMCNWKMKISVISNDNNSGFHWFWHNDDLYGFRFYVVLVWVDPIITADHGELAKNHASMAAVAFKFVIHGASPHGSQGTFTWLVLGAYCRICKCQSRIQELMHMNAVAKSGFVAVSTKKVKN